MQLEQQVCSLDLAKRLKELGVKQDGTFYWMMVGDEMKLFQRGTRDGDYWFGRHSYAQDRVPCAFTVAELGEMLPNTEDCISRREPNNKEWRCGNQIEPTEADARAKMLIYLLENKLA